MKIALISLLSLWLSSCVVLNPRKVSIAELNEHPQVYDGQRVTVQGYLLGGPEPIAVITGLGTEYNYEKLASECLSIVNFAGLDGELGTQLNGKYVDVTGVFRSGVDSHSISVTSCGLTELDIEGDPVNNIRITHQH